MLNVLAVDAWSALGGQAAHAALIATLKVNVFEVEGVDVAREVAEDGQANVDEEVGATACDHEYTYGWEQDGDEDNENSGDWIGACHFDWGC